MLGFQPCYGEENKCSGLLRGGGGGGGGQEKSTLFSLNSIAVLFKKLVVREEIC